jgi:hypothetical protein
VGVYEDILVCGTSFESDMSGIIRQRHLSIHQKLVEYLTVESLSPRALTV